MKHYLITLTLLLLVAAPSFSQLSKDKEIRYRVRLTEAVEKSDYKNILSNAQTLATHYDKEEETLAYLEVQSKIYQSLQALNKDADGYWQAEMAKVLPSFDGSTLGAIPKLELIKSNCSNYKALMNLLRLHMFDLAKSPNQIALDYALKADKIAQYLLKQAPSQSDKTFYLKQFSAIYNSAQDICYSLYQTDKRNSSQYIEQGFYFAEQYKSMLLKDALKEQEALEFGGIPNKLRQQYQSFKKDIASLYEDLAFERSKKERPEDKINLLSKTLKEKQSQFDALEKHFEQEYPKYFELKQNQKTVKIKTVQEKLLNDSTVFIEYVSGDAACYVYVIEQNKITWKQLPGKDSLHKILAPFVKEMITLKEDHIVSYSEKGYQVFQFLLEDVVNQLPTSITKLILVPDDKLHNLPFEVLMTEPVNNPTTFEKLPYLLRKYSTSYTYSAVLLVDNKGYKTVKNERLLGVAGMYSEEINDQSETLRSGRTANIRAALAPLPFAKEEVALLQKVFDGKFLFENEANEGQFKRIAKDYAVIHLAMHGLADPNHPAFSGLAFTENLDSTEDNILYLEEINNLNLQAKLVVLSACQTGIGKFQAGEGVVSIARSFMYAGAPSVIMTLWPVNDQATQIIMTDFYTFLKQGMAKDDALQAAKIKYLDAVVGLPAHPVLWAPYIQLGDNASIHIPASTTKTVTRANNLLFWVSIGFIFTGILLGGFMMRPRQKKK